MGVDVFCIENPLVDLLVQVKDEFLEQMSLKKDHMMLVDESRYNYLIDNLEGYRMKAEPGGSGANTTLGIAQLGGSTAYCGKVGNDSYGRTYIEALEAAGVRSFVRDNGDITGSTVILITPDAARTMNTFLGACQQLGPADIPLEELKQAKSLYITGYLWDTASQQEAASLALRTAGAEGVHVAMSLSDPFCVKRHRDDFRRILEGYVDLVFANQEEALELTGKETTQEAMHELRTWCNGAVITMGGRGAYVSMGEEHAYLDPYPVKAVDTTGAGDAFAAGFMYAHSQGHSLYQCGRLGSYFAAQVIQRIGPRLEGDVRALLAPVLNDPR